MHSFFDVWDEEYLSFLPALLRIVADLFEDINEDIRIEVKEVAFILGT